MIRELNVSNLSTQKEEIISTVQELARQEDQEKILNLKLLSTIGAIPEALEVIEKIHTSDVDLYIEASGEISPAGLLIACAGKPKHRKAHFSTIFKLKDNPEEGKKNKIKDPYSSCIIETLVGLGARKVEISEIYGSQFFITSIDAKRMKIIDDAGIVENKYKKVKKSEEVSEKVVDEEHVTT